MIREKGFLIGHYKMKRTLLLIIIGILISSFFSVNVENVSADPPNAYYVANDGNDGNSGTSQDSPWRTIGKVNTALGDGTISVGDNIYFERGDTFSDTGLKLRLGGTSGNWMEIGAYGSGARPIFDINGATAIVLYSTGVDYIRIQDLEITTSGGNYNAITFDKTGGVTNIHIKNIYAHDLSYNGIFLARINGYKIENCVVGNAVQCGFVIYGRPDHITNGIIRDCIASGCDDGFTLHDDSSNNYPGDNHVVWNCISHNNREEGFDIATSPGCENIIYKDCTAYGNGNSGLILGDDVSRVFIDNFNSHDQTGGGAEGLSLVDCDEVVVRNSVIYKSNDDLLMLNWYASSGITGDVTAVHNTLMWASITDNFIELNKVNGHAGNKIFKNNIFYSTASTSPNTFVSYEYGNTFASTNSNYVHNMWWRGDGANPATDTWWNDADSGTYDWSEWQAAAFTDGELRNNPELADPTGGDYTLSSNSPCIDAGAWLTTCNGGGISSTTVTVYDAGYFCDGFGLIDGDTIMVGSNEVTITDVNYGTNVITVDSSISWSNGDPVSYVYSGSAPDIGAYEFVSSGPDTTPPQISNVILTESNPLDTDPSFGWIYITATITDNIEVDNVLINISCPNGSSYSFSMNSAGSTYYYNTSTVFSNHGNFSYSIWANDTNGNPTTTSSYDFSMPPNWDLNNDGQCNLLDLTLISNHYGEAGPNGWIREDVNNNGIIQVLDLILITGHYNEEWWT